MHNRINSCKHVIDICCWFGRSWQRCCLSAHEASSGISSQNIDALDFTVQSGVCIACLLGSYCRTWDTCLGRALAGDPGWLRPRVAAETLGLVAVRVPPKATLAGGPRLPDAALLSTGPRKEKTRKALARVLALIQGEAWQHTRLPESELTISVGPAAEGALVWVMHVMSVHNFHHASAENLFMRMSYIA